MGVFASLSSNYRSWRAKQLPTASRIIVRDIVRTLPLHEALKRVGGGLTPLDVSSILRSADNGIIDRYIDLLNESRQKDCHLQSLLGTREIAVSQLPWVIKPAKELGERVASEANREVADASAFALRNAIGTGEENSYGFADLVSHISGATYYGFSYDEVEWAIRDTMAWPVGFRPVHHRRFEWNRITGALELRDQETPVGVNLVKRYPFKFVVHHARVNGDARQREGLGRVLMWAALFRNWDMSDWLRLAELSWKPWRFGTYKSGAGQPEIDELFDALEALTTNGVAVHSDKTDVNIEWPERGRGSKTEHEALHDHLGREMSKAVLGQTLTVEQGERGARSLGEVHDRVRKDIAESDALSVAAAVRRYLITPFVQLNFGDDVPIPSFQFITEDTPDMGAFARGVASLVMAGAKVPQWWVREKLGIPEPELGDEICQGQAVLELQPRLEGDESTVPELPTNVAPAEEDEAEEDETKEEEDQDDGGAPKEQQPAE